MGLFSSKKNQAPKADIPADILADVSVNGERSTGETVAFAAPSQNVNEVSRASTSPFLKSREVAPTPVVTPSVTEPDLGHVPPQDLPVASAPKAFQFSDQSAAPAEIHFTDIPVETKQPEVPPAPKPDFSQITQDKALTARHKEHLTPLKLASEPGLKSKKPLWSSANILSFVVFVLILGLISGGSWYYLNTRNAADDLPGASIDTLEEIAGMATEPSTGFIALDQTNYLTLDVETVNLEQIKNLLAEESQKMIREGITTPVEYLVVDMNKNPVAFSRFALLIGADTPGDLSEASLEPFSLYLFQDQGNLRVALAVTLNDEAGPDFPTNKTILPESLKKFFFSDEAAAVSYANTAFKETSYEGNTIFYTNITGSAMLSFDTSRQTDVLLMANSKNTLRSVIDKRKVGASNE